MRFYHAAGSRWCGRADTPLVTVGHPFPAYESVADTVSVRAENGCCVGLGYPPACAHNVSSKAHGVGCAAHHSEGCGMSVARDDYGLVADTRLTTVEM
jgi:hypothetical protein